MEKIMVWEGTLEKLVFEFESNLPDGFTKAKDWANSRTLVDGRYPQMILKTSLCRDAKENEISAYQNLKAYSNYSFRIEK